MVKQERFHDPESDHIVFNSGISLLLERCEEIFLHGFRGMDCFLDHLSKISSYLLVSKYNNISF